jgi:light-regulated signal transduction histidine kinase (bacteriophytochrome)
VVQYRRPGGDGQLAAATAVGGTPWILLLEFPRSVVFDRARAILRWFALLAVVVLGLGSVAAWGLSRGLTQPLVELAAAAEAISRGDHARRVSAARDDELGTLARAFNGMAQSVEDGRRQLQEQLAQLEQRIAVRTEELVVSNRELEAFSYSVSHDLRAPLRSIDGFSQALLEDCADQLDEHGKDHLRRVRAATQHLADLIEDLLGLARVTRAELRREPVDLTAMAHRVVAELREREPGRPVDFRCGDGLAVDADPRLLRVLLTNLLGNAWKFTSRQPRPRIEFGWTPDGDRPAYFVRDNGAGFDMAYVTKLFGVFQRLHSAAEFPGTGVGLATVQRIVHRHGGRVWAEAAVGQGASFYFSLEPR